MAELSNAFRGRRVLVTGDTGFKGSWLSFWLSEMGAEVTGYALPAEGPEALFTQLGLARLIRHVDGDIRDAQAVDRVFREARPEFVFHLAAQPLVRRSYADPKATFDTNVGGSINILESVRATSGLRSLIYVTSDKCYKNKEWVWGYRENDELGGRDPYSASKAAAEVIFASYQSSYFWADGTAGAASVRAGNVIGGGDWSEDRIVPDAIRALRSGAPIQLRNPGATRPWQHVLDPLHGYLQLAARLEREPRALSGAWNFGPDQDSSRNVRELAEGIVTGWGSGSVVSVADPGAPHEAGMLRLNCDKARHTLDWTPRWGFDRALRETVQWYRDVGSGKSALSVTRDQLAAFQEGRA